VRKDEYHAMCAEAAEDPKWCYLGQMIGAGPMAGANPAWQMAAGGAAPIFEAVSGGTQVPVKAAVAPNVGHAMLQQLLPLLALYGAGTQNPLLMGAGLAGTMMMRDRPISSGQIYKK
jgi:hypothetical protein